MNDSFEENSMLSNMRGSVQENPFSLPKIKPESKMEHLPDEKVSIYKKNYVENLSNENSRKNYHLDVDRKNNYNDSIERRNYNDNSSIERDRKNNYNNISTIEKEDNISRILSLEREDKKINLHNYDVKKILEKNHDSEKSMVERIYGYRANKQRKEISPLQLLMKARQQ